MTDFGFFPLLFWILRREIVLYIFVLTLSHMWNLVSLFTYFICLCCMWYHLSPLGLYPCISTSQRHFLGRRESICKVSKGHDTENIHQYTLTYTTDMWAKSPTWRQQQELRAWQAQNLEIRTSFDELGLPKAQFYLIIYFCIFFVILVLLSC